MRATALCSSQCCARSATQRLAPSRTSGVAPLPAPLAALAARQRHRSPAAFTSCSRHGQGRSRRVLLVTAAVKVRKGKQVLCNKTFKAKEGSAAAVAELCQGVAQWSQARMSDRSSGVLAYQFSEDDFEAGTFHFLELYANQKAMQDHNSHDTIKGFVAKLADHLEGPLGMVLYEYCDGKLGPACMEGDVKGEGGLDDATGTNKFGGGASMKQTSSSVDLTRIKEEDDEEKGVWGLKGINFKLPKIFGGVGGKAKK